jgi:hypothetical protein
MHGRNEAQAIQFQENEDADSYLESDILILVSLTGRAMRPRSADSFKKDSPPRRQGRQWSQTVKSYWGHMKVRMLQVAWSRRDRMRIQQLIWRREATPPYLHRYPLTQYSILPF